jgi:DUF438 domain-containing protein
MSELIGEKAKRKELLKDLILQMHAGEAPDAVRKQLLRLLGRIPHDEVVDVEQELISEGLPSEEILRLCDIHADALRGVIETTAPEVPRGHPVHTLQQENRALDWEITRLNEAYTRAREIADTDVGDLLNEMRGHFNALMDVEKHYQRKEHLLFPFLEQRGLSGPPTVMWGKHDETRKLLGEALEALEAGAKATAEELQAMIESILKPASASVSSMIEKEERIFLPLCLETFDEAEWARIYAGSDEIGYCIFAPEDAWHPVGVDVGGSATPRDGRVQLPTGSFSTAELEAVLNTIPFDVTFVDAEDTVRYFSHGRERIFARSKAILGRKVQYCHPPKSVETVQRIVDDFRSGRQSRAHFWITLGGRFVSIEYFALRDTDGAYLGTLEVSQDLTKKRALTGEQRLLSYEGGDGGGEYA